MFKYLNYSKLKEIASNKGSLLLEVLLAIVILSVSLTLIIQSFVSSLRAFVYSNDYSAASFLLDSKMFELMHGGFTQLDRREDAFPEPFERYRYKIEIEEVETDNPDKMLNEINLEIIWHSGTKEKKISAATYVIGLSKT